MSLPARERSFPFQGKDQKSIMVKIIPAISACLLLVLILAGFVWVYKFKGKHDKKGNPKRLIMGDLRITNGLEEESHELPFISFQEIVTATNNFSMSNLLGQGGFGKVYKGNIHGDKVVAVKRLSRGSGQGMIEFRSELVVIAKLQHRNLVRLLSYCVQDEEDTYL